MHHSKNNINGFTLVELAIVIVIIGLLVAGVLQGQELIKQAKIQSQIKQLSNIAAQTETFRAKYNCLPGDCTKATVFFGTTDKNGNAISNGDGDSTLRSLVGPGAPFASNDCLSPIFTGSELAQYWLHLNDAGLGNYTADGIGANAGTGYPRITGGNTGVVVTCLEAATAGYVPQNPNLKTGNIIAIGALWLSCNIHYWPCSVERFLWT